VVADYTNPLNQSLALLLRLHDGDLRELFEVRRILEVESAGLAALRRTDEDLAAMRDALERMEQGLRSAERYVGGDVHFHLAVAVATQNRIATHMMRAIRDVLRRALMSIYHIPGSPERSLGHHRRPVGGGPRADAGPPAAGRGGHRPDPPRRAESHHGRRGTGALTWRRSASSDWA
jgi:DNA-binding FadR family transcriptional regulator